MQGTSRRQTSKDSIAFLPNSIIANNVYKFGYYADYVVAIMLFLCFCTATAGTRLALNVYLNVSINSDTDNANKAEKVIHILL